MATNTDLAGLGMPPLLANELGAALPIAITAAGTTYAGSTKIKSNQYLVNCTNANNTLSVGLPPFGGDTGCSLADWFMVVNASVDSLVIRASTGVLIAAGGTNDSSLVLGAGKSVLLRPTTTVAWGGLVGA